MPKKRGTMWGFRTSLGACLLAGLLSALPARVACGGGGPENIFLVVNRQSWASQTVANHYIHLRKIPPGNVLYLDWAADVVPEVDINVMREKILLPVLRAIERRKLIGQIDAIIYSSDFPYSVDIRADDTAGRKTPLVSLTSMTYLWALTLKKQMAYMANDVNFYARDFEDGKQLSETRAFNGQVKWTQSGEPDNETTQGLRYLLSTMLAFTSGKGTSVGEAIAGFERNVAVDGTKPKGTIYLVKNKDIRSSTRHNLFPDVVTALGEVGITAEILDDTKVPQGKGDIQGAVIGWPQFDWSTAKNTILPGAIVEHLTSFGGYLGEINKYQTPLTDFLRYGAAGSSGTVSEPGALLAKFPHPFVQVHYARGCSLAESFYQSVQGPAQLLIVGDPLCQPWADIPTDIGIDGVEADQTVSGTLTLTPRAQVAGDGAIGRFELFVDGRRNQTCESDGAFTLDTTRHVDGYHELRVVAIGAGLIATGGRLVLPVSFDNHGRSIELDAGGVSSIRWDEQLVIKANAPGATRLLLYQNSRLIKSADEPSAEWSIEPQSLGLGPITLRAIAYGAGGANEGVISQSVSITVEPPPPLPAESLYGDKDDSKAEGEEGSDSGVELVDGLQILGEDDQERIIVGTKAEDWLGAAGGISAGEEFILSAFFEVPKDDVYQFQLVHTGRLSLLVNGREIYRKLQGSIGDFVYLPISLGEGMHELTVTGKAGPRPLLDIRFGGPGVSRLDGKRFRHPE